MKIKDNVFVVTGASSGLGAATARMIEYRLRRRLWRSTGPGRLRGLQGRHRRDDLAHRA